MPELLQQLSNIEEQLIGSLIRDEELKLDSEKSKTAESQDDSHNLNNLNTLELIDQLRKIRDKVAQALLDDKESELHGLVSSLDFDTTSTIATTTIDSPSD